MINSLTQIKTLRVKYGLNQKELAQQAGVSQSLIAKIEAGKAKNPTFDTLSKLADVFGISMDELTGRRSR